MSLIIREISYNTFNNKDEKETIAVDLSVKFGIDKDNFNERIIFLELNMDGTTDDEEPTRRLFVVASFNYAVSAKVLKENDFQHPEEYVAYFEELLKEQPKDDQPQLMSFLKKIDELVSNMTIYDSNRTSLDIKKAIEMYETEG